jgi:hypothetical protein
MKYLIVDQHMIVVSSFNTEKAAGKALKHYPESYSIVLHTLHLKSNLQLSNKPLFLKYGRQHQ